MVSVPESLGRRTVATILAAAMALLPAVASAQKNPRGGANNPLRNIAVASTDGTSFVGNFSIQRFQEVGGQLLAVGELSGKLGDGTPVNRQSVAWPVSVFKNLPPGALSATSAKGTTVPAVYDPSRPPAIINTQAACDILNLVLGPLHLDLLGLVIDLDTVRLDITAEPGPGNLLGNLLCAIVGILDPGGPLADLLDFLNLIANLLNGILDAADVPLP